jgi:hypothetical protein
LITLGVLTFIDRDETVKFVVYLCGCVVFVVDHWDDCFAVASATATGLVGWQNAPPQAFIACFCDHLFSSLRVWLFGHRSYCSAHGVQFFVGDCPAGTFPLECLPHPHDGPSDAILLASPERGTGSVRGVELLRVWALMFLVGTSCFCDHVCSPDCVFGLFAVNSEYGHTIP